MGNDESCPSITAQLVEGDAVNDWAISKMLKLKNK